MDDNFFLQHKHQILNGLHNLFFPVSLHAFFSSFAKTPSPLPFVSLHPASFSTCAGCTPGLQTRLCVFPVLEASYPSLPVFLHQHAGNLTTVFALNPAITLPSNWSPNGKQMQQCVGGKYINKGQGRCSRQIFDGKVRRFADDEDAE